MLPGYNAPDAGQGIDVGISAHHGAGIQDAVAAHFHVILCDGVQVPHYNYVGDSILGYKSHMGAGSLTSNIKSDQTPVVIRNGDQSMETGLIKVGAMVGDHVEVGCNSVLNPGTVIGSHTNVYPLSSVRGYVPENSIYKSRDAVVKKRTE